MTKILRNKFVQPTAAELEAIGQALEGRSLAGTSAVVGQYERELSRTFGSAHAIACSSGTAALHAALMAFGIQPGDEVVLPPTAPVMTALPVLAVGATPVFVDVVRANRFGVDPTDLGRAVTSRTRAIILVPMWGYPCWSREAAMFARARQIPIIEDAAQAHGSRSGDKCVGTLGDLGCFSTHERKLICTGEGGFLLTDDATLDARLREICMFGRQIVARPGLEQYAGKFGATVGLNFKLNALAAAMGVCQVGRLKDRIAARTRNADYLREHLGPVSWLTEIPVDAGDQANYYAMVLEVDADFGSARRVAALLAERGIISDTFDYDYMPLYRLPIFARHARPCPHAEALTERVITLPTHEGLAREDLDFIVATIARLPKNLES